MSTAGEPRAAATAVTDLFVYGELRRVRVLRELLGRLPAAEPAILHDHVRRPDPRTGYFKVRPATGARVAGLLLRNVDPASLARIDEYEGAGYRRARVEVVPSVAPEEATVAWVYVASESARGR